MSSLARDLIDAALAADLSKNEYKVFLALYRQTLCYGKAADPLTLKRLADLTGIRKDRLAQAVQGVIAAGLFESNAHKLFDTLYTIGRGFFAASAPFFAPHLPVNGNTTRTTEAASEIREDLPESRVHTSIHLTTLTPTALTTTTHPTETAASASDAAVVVGGDLMGLSYPKTFTDAERQQAARCLDGLHPELASDCLKILTLSLEAGRVKSSLGYLNQLGKAARAGSLDRSLLAPPNVQIQAVQAVNSNPQAEQRYRLQTLAADIQALDRLQALAGLPMDASTQAHRQTLISEFNALKTQLQGVKV